MKIIEKNDNYKKCKNLKRRYQNQVPTGVQKLEVENCWLAK
jgi:hypothetical protein